MKKKRFDISDLENQKKIVVVIGIIILLAVSGVIIFYALKPILESNSYYTTNNEDNDTTENNYSNVVGDYTHVLYVHKDGDNSTGESWDKAFTTINGAYYESSSDLEDLTLIVIGIGTYDLDSNYSFIIEKNIILYGIQNRQVTIINSNSEAERVISVRSYVKLYNLIINMGNDKNIGISISVDGCKSYIKDVTIISTNLLTTNYCLMLCNNSCSAYIENYNAIGTNKSIGVYIYDSHSNRFENFFIQGCNIGININHATADVNILHHGGSYSCYYGIKIDAGNEQVIIDYMFFNCTDNIYDVVGDSVLQDLQVDNPQSSLEPSGLTGITVNGGAGASTYGSETVIYTSSTHPFIVTAVMFDFSVNERCGLRLSFDGGITYFFEIGLQIIAVGTIFLLEIPFISIFNAGSVITCSIMTESGADTAEVSIQVLTY